MGVKNMLSIGANAQGEQLKRSKEISQKRKAATSLDQNNSSINDVIANLNESPSSDGNASQPESEISDSAKNQKIEKTAKNKGGRPELPKGEKRKQYTLTLQETKRAEIMAAAKSAGMSFSKYVEAAVDEYMHNHDFNH